MNEGEAVTMATLTNTMASTLLQDKFQQPGWRIEQRYRPGVLIGNWSEERYEFERQGGTPGSTHRTDFQHPGCVEPEHNTRRRMALASEGLGRNQLFTHHGKRYTHNCISLYDQEFNHRRHHTTPRSWDWHRLAWLPEVSDHPVQGEGTKWGLRQALQEKWARKEREARVGSLTSVYTLHFSRHLTPSAGKHFASPRKLSSQLRPASDRRDLQLGNRSSSGKPEEQPADSSPHTPTAEGVVNQLNVTI